MFSIDGSSYQLWQAELLAYSHKKVGQPGPLTCLVSTNDPPYRLFDGMFFGPAASPHPLTGDDYAPYNKPHSLGAWLRAAPPEEEIILLLDPDCVFHQPLSCTVARGQPIGQPIGYMHVAPHAHVVQRHYGHPERLDPVGIPILIHRDDLVRLAPIWFTRTEALRADPVSREHFGWTCEMWAYCIAAAELGLRHRLHEMAQTSVDQRLNLPITHYCYGWQDTQMHWQWDKRTYRPWSAVSNPPIDAPAALVAVIQTLNEFAAMKQGEPAI